MGKKRIINLFLFLVIFLGLLIPSYGLMKKVPVKDLLNKATIILAGTVTDITYHWSEQEKSIYTNVYLWAKIVVKGTLRTDHVVIQLPGGEWNGIFQMVSDIPEFRIGEQVLSFLIPSTNNYPFTDKSSMKIDHQAFTVLERYQGKYTIDHLSQQFLLETLQQNGQINDQNFPAYEDLINKLQEKISKKSQSDPLKAYPTYSYLAGGAHWPIGAVINYRINANCADVSD